MILIRYGEISLKGQNRPVFERRLAKNLKACLDSNGVSYETIRRENGRIIIETESQCSELVNVFGVVSLSYAEKVNNTVEDICKIAAKIVKTWDTNKTFRVNTQRIDKNFPLTSVGLDKTVGQFVVDETKMKVSLKNHEYMLGIEIIKGNAYVFSEKVSGECGLPVGVSGTVACFLEDEKSILAAFLMMKRGCSVVLFSNSDFDFSLLEKYSYGISLKLHKISSLSEIKKGAVLAIVVGQTLSEFKELDTDLAVLRPLIGHSDDEISSLLSRIKNE